jgi:hypothetical protein
MTEDARRLSITENLRNLTTWKHREMSKHQTSKKLARERELSRKRAARAAARGKRKHVGQAMTAGDQSNAPIIRF